MAISKKQEQAAVYQINNRMTWTKVRKNIAKNWEIYVMLIPVLAFYIVFKLGERVSSMCMMMARWFCHAFLKYGAMPVEQMPFDQDMLVAAMAPRPVYITSGSRDYWSDPEAEFRAAKSAGQVYEALGKKGLVCEAYPQPDTAWNEGSVGYALRKGPHDMTEWDWLSFCDFETKHFG